MKSFFLNFSLLALVTLISCDGPDPQTTSMTIDGDGFRFCGLNSEKCMPIKFKTWTEWLQENPDYNEGQNNGIDEAVKKGLRPNIHDSVIDKTINFVIRTSGGDIWDRTYNLERASDGYSILVKSQSVCDNCTLEIKGTTNPAFKNELGIRLGQRPIPNSGIIPELTDPIDIIFPIGRSLRNCGSDSLCN